MIRFVTAAVLVVVAACQPQRPAKPPSQALEFASTLGAAQRKADSGDYAAADRILAEYAQRNAGTREAQEISFWRAVYLVDPANKTSSTAEGIRALDIYLSSEGLSWYKPQALVLRRTAAVVQALRQQQPAVATIIRQNGRDTVFVSREEEISELRQQLARANTELERIRRRLANPER